MIKITKKAEPREWTEIRNTPGITYDSTPKDILRQALLNEQGGLCAYCMRRINYTPGDTTTTRIEHIKSRKQSLNEGKPEETLSYNNMVLCCDGNIAKDGDFHCDRSKEDSPISFTPFEQHVIDTISYCSMDGRIKSSNPDYDEDLNKTLNLNHPILKGNRKETIKGLVKALGKEKWKRKDLEEKLKRYTDTTSNRQLHPYCGVIVWFLNKRLKQYK